MKELEVMAGTVLAASCNSIAAPVMKSGVSVCGVEDIEAIFTRMRLFRQSQDTLKCHLDELPKT